MSLALPWEVIEGVIEHSSDSVVTLYSFTLTCRDLNPRSTILLLGRIVLKNRDQLFALCDVLSAKPHLQPIVRSITISPNEFSPHPLLGLLSNLSEIEFATTTNRFDSGYATAVTVHSSVLKYCRQFGEHIQSLSLERLDLPSLSAFSGFLLSFRRIRSLSCSHLKVVKDGAHQELITRRLSQQLHLRTLVVSVDHTVSENVLTLLGEVAKHTLTNLIFINADFPNYKELQMLLGPSTSSSWVHLTSLSLLGIHLDSQHNTITTVIQHVIATLDHLRHAKLQEITIDFQAPTIRTLVRLLRSGSRSALYPALEGTLLRFPQPSMQFSLRKPINIRRHHTWTDQIERSFPSLVKRHALTIKAELSDVAGHDSRISTPIVTSADSRWAATGSEDNTIIIWDLSSGSISQEWFIQPPDFPDPDPILNSLAFSPDSRYLISTRASERGVTVWDLHRSACKVISLGDDKVARHCAWSADGTFIVAGLSNPDTVRLWEANTFRQLHPRETWNGQLLALSADGRWVATRVLDGCRIWNVASGKLQCALRCHGDQRSSAAFDPEGAHVVTRSSVHSTAIHIWDVNTGVELLTLQVPMNEAESWVSSAVAYSPDGKLVLSWPSMAFGSVGKVWDASSGALLARLDTPDRAVLSACCSPCSRYVASASEDGAALLWRTSDGLCIARISGDGSRVDRVAISPDGRVLCCGAEDGRVFFRQMRDLIPADQSS